MKNIIKIITLFIVAVSCKAQTPVFDIEDFENIAKDIYGAYHKDTQNQLNPFEGTYIYTIGSTSLKIVLQKKIMSSMNGYYYEDIIIGEYQYIENGIEKRNTLSKFNNINVKDYHHGITGNLLLVGTYRGCTDCGPTEKRLAGGLIDDTANALANIQLRRIIVNGKAAIKLSLYWETKTKQEGQVLVQPFIAPGSYTLIKEIPVTID